jgi:hypothetical protein
MRFISDFEIVIRRLITKELQREINRLKELYPSCFLEGGTGKKGGLKENFGARYIIANNVEGIFALHRLIDLSDGFYEAYARVFVSNSDIPEVKYCNGMRHHKTVYTTNETCPICRRKTKKTHTLTKECQSQLKEFKVSLDDL